MGNTKRVISDMPLETYQRLQELAKKHDRSVSSMIARLVAISVGEIEPMSDPVVTTGTQVNMPTTAEEREAMLGRVR